MSARPTLWRAEGDWQPGELERQLELAVRVNERTGLPTMAQAASGHWVSVVFKDDPTPSAVIELGVGDTFEGFCNRNAARVPAPEGFRVPPFDFD